jgi:acyl-CoA thioester hydrolase
MEFTQTLPKELESRAIVRFQDCDPFQHLNNARYIDYIFNAREDQLIEFYNFSIFDHSKVSNAGWVVTKTQIAYLYPAVVREEVIIRTRLLHNTDSAIAVEGIMFDKEMKRPKAVMWVEFTYISLATGRTTQHPDDLMQLFATVRIDDEYRPDGFDERVENVKRQYRKQPVEAAVN